MRNTENNALVRMEGVSRSYNLGHTEVHALAGVDLDIAEREFVAIWGPSGSGKSTLCNLIGGIDVPSAGSVHVGGRNLGLLSDDELSDLRNRSIGFVFQQFNLVPVLTALENVMLPLNLRGETGQGPRQRALALLDELEIAEFARQRPDQLSGGQRQRVAVARALVTNPRLVIADEPTANLDSATACRIVDLMGALNSSKQVTFIFSTHDERLLDRVNRRLHLKDGRIVEDTGRGGAS